MLVCRGPGFRCGLGVAVWDVIRVMSKRNWLFAKERFCTGDFGSLGHLGVSFCHKHLVRDHLPQDILHLLGYVQYFFPMCNRSFWLVCPFGVCKLALKGTGYLVSGDGKPGEMTYRIRRHITMADTWVVSPGLRSPLPRRTESIAPVSPKTMFLSNLQVLGRECGHVPVPFKENTRVMFIRVMG